MITFRNYLSEKEEDNAKEVKGVNEYIFNFQILRLKVIPKLQSVLDTVDDFKEIPGRVNIDFMDILQMIKQLIIDHHTKPDFIELLKSDLEKALKITYPESNTMELYRVIETEMIENIEKSGVDKIRRNIDMYDPSMDSKDEFGKLLYRIYDKVLKKEENLDQTDLNSIKIWINKLKRGGDSLSSKIRNRIHLKDKLFDKIEKDEEFEEIDL